MSSSRFIYPLKPVADTIDERLELIEEVTANSDNISEGELIYVSNGVKMAFRGLTENGIDELQNLLADIRTWDGGIRQFLVDAQCDLDLIERVMADEMKRGLYLRSFSLVKMTPLDAHDQLSGHLYSTCIDRRLLFLAANTQITATP